MTNQSNQLDSTSALTMKLAFTNSGITCMNGKLYCALMQNCYKNGMRITRKSSAPKLFRLPVGAIGFFQQYVGQHGTGYKIVIYARRQHNAKVLYVTFPEVKIKWISG